MRFDPLLAYCFRRKNKIRDSENTDIAGDKRILTLQIEDDGAGNCRAINQTRTRDLLSCLLSGVNTVVNTCIINFTTLT